MENDELRINEELESLGILTKDLRENKNIIETMETIKEKARIECAKIYVGPDLSKLIANSEKMPVSLIQSISDFIIEIDKLRIFTIRELKILSNGLINLTNSIPENIYEFIYSYTLLHKNKQEGNYPII